MGHTRRTHQNHHPHQLRGVTKGRVGRDVSFAGRRGAGAVAVRRVLPVVQGHPKPMELADAAAADRARLDAFFRDGDCALEPATGGEDPDEASDQILRADIQ
jgi:hypothetical protein